MKAETEEYLRKRGCEPSHFTPETIYDYRLDDGDCPTCGNPRADGPADRRFYHGFSRQPDGTICTCPLMIAHEICDHSEAK
jgi:hypothetical protein